MPFSRVSVIGLGYIGLPTAALFATRGFEVVGVDIRADIVDTVNAGRVHIVEPGLDVMVRGAVATGRLRATMTPEPAEVFLIAVPTPFKEDHEPDLQYIRSSAKAVAPVLRPGNLVVLESTSPIGTTEQLARWLADERPDLTFPHQKGEDADIFVAHCPERVLPGNVVRELVENDRVIGGVTRRSGELAAEFYRQVISGSCVLTDARTAELCKLVENAFRDVNIAFANEISLICDRLGIDPWTLIKLANRHPRVKILQPGPGVGGHCIAVDPWFIVHSDPENAQLIRTARKVNDHKPHWVLEQVLAAAQGRQNPCILCAGLAFKPNIDDLRESPALEIVERLSSRDFRPLLVAEPNISQLPPTLRGRPGVELVDIADGLERADIVVLLVDHREFLAIDRRLLKGKTVIDTRGAWQ